MFDELYGQAEHDDFELGREDMERRVYRLSAEREMDLELMCADEEAASNYAADGPTDKELNDEENYDIHPEDPWQPRY